MLYSNPDFIILAIATLTLYFLFKRSYGLRFYLLLVSSLIFYSWAGWIDTAIFFSVVAFSWLATLAAHKFSKQKTFFLTIGVVVMLLHLFFWKYAPWLTRSIQRAYPSFLGGRKILLPLPIGISFFTLQGVAYLIDFGRGEAEFIGFKKYFLFKSFFPQLVAGPIVRVHQLLPQLEALTPPSTDDVWNGLCLFCLGFFKKIAIADRMAPFVDPIFQNPSHFDRLALIQAVLAYSLQIWGDFSGYTDMGRGVARMLGIRLPQNFLSPYFARTPSEFWRRWHITLSEWIRDYVYFPLGGSRGNRLKVVLVAVFTMVVSGLWHGAAFTFLLWGLYHGFLLVFERLLRNAGLLRSRPTWFAAIPMFCLTSFGWLIFRAQSLGNFVDYMRSVTRHPGLEHFASVSNLAVGILACGLIQGVSYFSFETKSCPLYERLRSAFFPETPGVVLNAVYGTAMAAIFVLTIFLRIGKESTGFIYFKF